MNLSLLDLSGNIITNINCKDIIEVDVLRLSYNRIYSFSCLDIKSESLDLSSNRLSYFHVNKINNLKYLNIAKNPIKELFLNPIFIDKLVTLNLYQTNIESLQNEIYNLPKLKYIYSDRLLKNVSKKIKNKNESYNNEFQMLNLFCE